MRVGVIPHVLPLLFAYDATAEADDGDGDAADATAAAAASGAMAAAEERGPKFLGLGIVRANAQVSLTQITTAAKIQQLGHHAACCSVSCARSMAFKVQNPHLQYVFWALQPWLETGP